MPTDQLPPRRGWSFPAGASLATDPADGCTGVNFSVTSHHATAVTVLLFGQGNGDTLATTPDHRIALHNLGHGHWAAFVPGLQAGQRYALCANGPRDPAHGHRFEPAQTLIDPWACGLLGPTDLLARPDAQPIPHSLVVNHAAERAAGAAIAPRPRIAADRVVIYEAHVKSLTRLHPGVPEAQRGTYAGLASPAMLAHLKTLGITTVCLLPVHQRLTEHHLLEKGLTNHWGYNPLNVFTPDPRFAACTQGQAPHTPEQAAAIRAEFRQMVDALHRAGLEVVLDVVFNHTAESDHHGPTLSWRGLDNATWYALDEHGQPHNFSGCGNSLNLGHRTVTQWVMDSLRWWVQAYGVDGFRFDLATALGRQAEHHHAFSAGAALLTALHQDPVLATVRLIAEPWDLGPDGYRLGHFPPGWQEWNDRFRDTTRAFWLGHRCTPGDMARVLLASSDRFQHSGKRPSDSINFITAHDGYTLADLTAYTQRHNQANGEDNRDGHGHNLSANAGTEGPSTDAAILSQRRRWQRALLATLLLSQGTPQLLAGDELGHSQRGNNNAYCQDNPTTWLDWAQADHALIDWVGTLAAVRQHYPALRWSQWFTGQPLLTRTGEQPCPLHDSRHNHCPPDCSWTHACTGPDVAWHSLDGTAMTPRHWDDPTLRSVVCTLAVSETGAPPTERLLLVLHADPAPCVLPLPPGTWQARLDSSGLLASQGVYRTRIEVPGCTVLLLVQALQTTHPERPPAFPAPIHPETL